MHATCFDAVYSSSIQGRLEAELDYNQRLTLPGERSPTVGPRCELYLHQRRIIDLRGGLLQLLRVCLGVFQSLSGEGLVIGFNVIPETGMIC